MPSTTLVRGTYLLMYTKALLRKSWRFLKFESTISIRNLGPSGYMDQLTLDLRYWEIGHFTDPCRTALIAERPSHIELPW